MNIPAWSKALVATLCLIATGGAGADTFPARPIQMLIGTPPGGIADTVGRALAESMSKRLGGSVVVLNRDGANGVIAAGQVVAARPDGYTLGFQPAGAFVTQPFLNKNLPYTNADVDFLCQLFELPLAVAVAADAPFRSVGEIVEAARKRPGAVNVGHAGLGSIPQIGFSRLEQVASVKFNLVTFRGDGEILLNVLGRHVDVGAIGLATTSGKPVRVLSVFSGKRVASHPDVPTMSELGYPIVTEGMVGLYTRKGVPADVREKLVGACRDVAVSEEFVRATARANQAVSYLGPEQWTARIEADGRQNKAVIDSLPPAN